MADPLYELLLPYFDRPSPQARSLPKNPIPSAYLNRLTTLPLSSLTTTERQSLSQKSSTLILSLQALSKRSHKSIITSSTHLSTLHTELPRLAQATATLRDTLPRLDDAALNFSENYNLRTENEVIDRRRKALLLSRNIDRLADLLDLPTLLSSAVASSTITTSSFNQGGANYASALDLNAHIKRLHALYPDSQLVNTVSQQAEGAILTMVTNLIGSLRHPSLKLAAAMRTISWLRRVAPELDAGPVLGSHTILDRTAGSSREGSLGNLFLVCRLANLHQMLGALEPLRDLADQETTRLRESQSIALLKGGKWEAGLQTERYLKRYIEIFREQSFAIISMYRSIFPSGPAVEDMSPREGDEDPLRPLPSALATFPLTLVSMLEGTLRRYLPNVKDKSTRDSLLTQVLYCAGSLGRLDGDFSLILAFLREDDGDAEEEIEDWVDVVKKHRVLAERLELMLGTGKEG